MSALNDGHPEGAVQTVGHEPEFGGIFYLGLAVSFGFRWVPDICMSMLDNMIFPKTCRPLLMTIKLTQHAFNSCFRGHCNQGSMLPLVPVAVFEQY